MKTEEKHLLDSKRLLGKIINSLAKSQEVDEHLIDLRKVGRITMSNLWVMSQELTQREKELES